MKVSTVALLSLCSSSAASAFVTLGGPAKLHQRSSELNGSPDFNDFLDNPFPGRNQGREQPSQPKPLQPKQVVPDSLSARQKPQSPPPQPTLPWIPRRTGGRPLQVDNTAPTDQAPKRIDPFMSKAVTETSEKSSADDSVVTSETVKVPNETDNSTPEQSTQPDTTAAKPPPLPATSWKPPVVIGGVDSSRSNALQSQRRNTPSVRYYKGMNPQVSAPIRRPNMAGGAQGKPTQVPPPTRPSPKPRPGPRAWKPTLVQKPKVNTPTTASTSAATADAANKAAKARKAVMEKRQEAAIARKAAQRESALQVQQRVAKLREQRRLEQERKRQERLERAASQEENRRIEQDRKRQELVAREEERRALAIQEEEKRKETAANAAAKLAEARKTENQRDALTKDIPDEPTDNSSEYKLGTDSVEPDEKTIPMRPDARVPKVYVSGRQQVPPKAALKLVEVSKTETKNEYTTSEIRKDPGTPSTDSAKPEEKTIPMRPDARLPRGYAGGREQVPKAAAANLARTAKPVQRPLVTARAPPRNKPVRASGASTTQGRPDSEGTSMKPDSRLPIGNVDEQRAKVAARLARSVQPVRPVGYSNRAIPKKSLPGASVKSGPTRTFMSPDARLPLATVDEQREKAAKIAARLARTVQPVRKSEATIDSGKAATSKPVADTDTVNTDAKEKSTKPDSRLPTRNVVQNMDSTMPNYLGQMNQAGTMPAADAKEPIAWVFEETQPPPTLDRMSRPKVEPAVEAPPNVQVKETSQAAVEEATKVARHEEKKKIEQQKLREAKEALRVAEQEAKKIAYERKQIEEQVQLVSKANAKRILEIETRAKRESFRKQRALLDARLSMVQNARAAVLKKRESFATQRALLTARLDMDTKRRILKIPTNLEMTNLAVPEESDTIDDTMASLEDPIPPQFRVLSAKYMARLEKAARSNPKSLKDEFEKLRIAKEGENDNGDSPYVQ